MNFSLRNKGILAVGLMIGAALFGAACSDDGETGETTAGGGGTAGSGGAGGDTTASSSSSSTGAGGSGQGGMGGMGGGSACGDTMTDPMNCGACGNPCAPGQTCETGKCTCAAGATATMADVQAIFSKSCGSAGNCHNKANPSAGLSLMPGNSHGSLVNVDTNSCGDGRKRVLPGEPSESYIIDKVMNKQLCKLGNGMNSQKMPPGSTLPMADIETIANWICAGAPQ